MKKANTAIRLKEIMEKRNLRQIDILNLTSPYCQKYNIKMNKSDISQYCSGKAEPNQDKLYVLGEALNVSEAWLMGFDVPMERTIWVKYDDSCSGAEASDEKVIKLAQNILKFHGESNRLIKNYEQLSDINKKKVIDYSDNLLKIQQMEEEQEHLIPVAAHERTDIEVTDEMRKHDDDLMNNDELWK